MSEKLKEDLYSLMMVQYKEGMRDGIKSVKEVLQSAPSTSPITLALLDSILSVATKDAAGASQKLQGL